MVDIKRGFFYQWESGKKEIGLHFAVIFLLGAIFFPALNFFIASKQIVASEKWIPGVLGIYQSLIHLAIIDLVQSVYYKEFPSMIKQGITRETFFKVNIINLFIRIVIVSFTFTILGKALRYYLSIFYRPDLLKGGFIYGYNYDLIKDSFLFLFSKVFFTLLLASFSTNIMGAIYYKRGFSEKSLVIFAIIINGLLGLGLGASNSLGSILNNNPSLIQLTIGVLVFLLGSYISKYIIKKTDVLN